MAEDKLATIASLALLLVAGTVLGRLHEKGEATAVGDRVMCGLLSLPLIALGVHYAFPQHPVWTVVAPVPVLIYTLLLATTERYEWTKLRRQCKTPVPLIGHVGTESIKGISPFTLTLLIGVGLTYFLMFLAAFGHLQKFVPSSLYSWLVS
jgi:hypothetical protein